jgi:hypothetical protein
MMLDCANGEEKLFKNLRDVASAIKSLKRDPFTAETVRSF